MGRIKRKPRKRKARELPIEMPSNGATEKILIAYFDVSSLSDRERDALQLEVSALHDHSPLHPSIPEPTFAFQTMKRLR